MNEPAEPPAARLRRELERFGDTIGQRAAAIGYGELAITVQIRDGVPAAVRFEEVQSIKLR